MSYFNKLRLHSVTKKKLELEYKSPSEVVNIAASKKMNSFAGDDLKAL
jgi:hypothetical protein